MFRNIVSVFGLQAGGVRCLVNVLRVGWFYVSEGVWMGYKFISFIMVRFM